MAADLPQRPAEERVLELEAQLAAAQRTIGALIQRAERRVGADPADRFALLKAMSSLEDAVAARSMELERSEAHFRALWDHSPDMLLIIDAEGRVLEYNAAAAELSEGREWIWQLFADPKAARGLAKGHFEGADQDGHTLLGGGEVLVATASLSEDGGTRLVGLRDVTSFRAVEAELQESRRLAALGQFATSVANGINNPLAVILGRVELLEALGEIEPELLSTHLQVIADHAQRISGIVDAVLSFARPALGGRESVGLQGLLQQAIDACGRRLGSLRVDLRVTPPELAVQGDAVQLEQAFVAIIGAIADAVHRRGRLRFHARMEEERCVVELLDSSHRPPPRGLRQALSRVGDLSVAASDGQHLGALMAANILREHGGWLRTVEGSAEGAVLRVELPCSAAPARGQARRVLVIDGDEQLADQVRAVLAADRVEVVTAPSSALAQRALSQGSFDLVLSALNLPDGSALGLRAAVEARWPRVSRRMVVVVRSGQWGVPGVRSIRRPVSRDALLALLNEG